MAFVIPVLDVRHGVVVRGVAGLRDTYQPIVSQLCNGADPICTSHAIRHGFDLNRLYLADLDALAGTAQQIEVWQRLHSAGFDLLVDAGVRDCPDATEIAQCFQQNSRANAGDWQVVLGLETLAGLSAVREILTELGPRHVVFSLDLREGFPWAACEEWRVTEPTIIAKQVIEAGIREMILLDVARVGTGRGVGTEALCEQLHRQHPDVGLITGGGLRDRDDLYRQRIAGASGVLIASALHDGRLSPQEVHEFDSITT